MFQRTATRQLTVTHSPGLHARPSLAIVQTVSRFKSKVRLRHADEEVDAGQIIEIMSLGVPQGAQVTLSAHGPDAEEALDALAALFAGNFGFGDE